MKLFINIYGLVTGIAIFISINADAQANKPAMPFDQARAKVIAEKQNRDLESALRRGDSIGAGNFYTIDAILLPSRVGRDAIIKDVGEMVRDSITNVQLTLTSLSGDQNILVEDAKLSIYYPNGNLAKAGSGLMIWKKIGNEWKIFREVWRFDNK